MPPFLYRDSLHDLIEQLWLEAQGKGTETSVQESFRNVFKWEAILIAARFSKIPRTQQTFVPILEEWKSIKSKTPFWDQKQRRQAYRSLMQLILKQLEDVDALSFLDQGTLVESLVVLQQSDPLNFLKNFFLIGRTSSAFE